MDNAEATPPKRQPANSLANRQHTEADECRLFEYLDHHLSATDARIVEVHLADCGVCQGLAEHWQRLDAELAPINTRHRPRLSPNFSMRLWERIAVQSTTPGNATRAEFKDLAENELSAACAGLRRRFLRPDLPTIAESLGCLLLAACALYYLTMFNVHTFGRATTASAGAAASLNLALSVGLLSGLACLGFVARKQVSRWLSAL